MRRRGTWEVGVQSSLEREDSESGTRKTRGMTTWGSSHTYPRNRGENTKPQNASEAKQPSPGRNRWDGDAAQAA